MMNSGNNRNSKAIVYSALWAIAVSLYMLVAMRRRAQLSTSLIDAEVVAGMIRTFLPLFLLFLISNNFLIPKLLLRNRWKSYAALTACALAGLWTYQYFDFIETEKVIPHHHPVPPPDMRPLLPLPVLLDFTYGLLVVGVNLAVTLMFQHYADRLERESLQKRNAETQLAYLKAQINPHFYLNMLNNIHGLIEIDPERAQTMLIDMSRLMRFMLYDSSKPEIPLADEIGFLENYLQLMRQRYPESKVRISWQFPTPQEASGISLPPLLFLSFIENAFKHGISYKEASFIEVKTEVAGAELRFSCINSVAPRENSSITDEKSGIGLNNVRERLRLLYGTRALLRIEEKDTRYSVELIIPVNGTKDTNHRR